MAQQQIKAKWALNADWNKDSGEIDIEVSEEISGKQWKISLGKNAYNNPREAYDKIRPVIEGGNMEIVVGMPEDGEKLTVKITQFCAFMLFIDDTDDSMDCHDNTEGMSPTNGVWISNE